MCLRFAAPFHAYFNADYCAKLKCRKTERPEVETGRLGQMAKLKEREREREGGYGDKDSESDARLYLCTAFYLCLPISKLVSLLLLIELDCNVQD